MKQIKSTPRVFLHAFAILFGIALTSGFYHYIVPKEVSWLASQLTLIVHIISGILSFLSFVPYLVTHQRDKEGRSVLLVTPWRAWRSRADESTRERLQRRLGHSLHWSTLVLVLSGLIITIPAILFQLDIIWLPSYLHYRISSAIHLGATFIVVGLILLHWLLRKPRKEGNIL